MAEVGSTSFPSSWGHLKHPYVRHELLGYLEEVVTASVEEPFDIDDVFHFFFDDTDLAEDPKGSVGIVLLNSEEASALEPLGAELRSLVDQLGDVVTAAYLTHSQWPELRKRAQAALDLLKREGVPVLS